MISEDLIDELTFLYFISYDFPQLQYDEKDFKKISDKKAEWKTLSTEEKQVQKNNFLAWLEDYKTKFPGQFEVVASNWKKVDWS